MRYKKYGILIKQYKNKIYTYSLFMLRNRMDADDVTQEVFIRLWQNIDKFNILSAKTWIMKTTNNLCIDYLRKRSKELKRSTEIDEVFIETHSNNDNWDNPLIATHNNIVFERVKESIEKLPDNLKSIFILYEINGLKYKEISKTLDMPINTIKVYLLRARKKLQEELKIYEHEAV